MRITVKTALGGMCAALSVAVMFLSAFAPVLTYAIPAIAGVLVFFMCVECGRSWGLGVYAATALISAILVPDKEAVGMYIALFGCYPILKFYFEKPKKVIAVILKSLFYIVVTLAAYYVMIKLFGISAEFIDQGGKYFILLLMALGLVVFLIYDKTLSMYEFAYYRKWQKKLRKLFSGGRRR